MRTLFQFQIGAVAALLFCANASAQYQLSLPATGVWNGYLGHVNVIECSNLEGDPTRIDIAVRDSANQLIGSTTLPLAGLGTQHLILNGYPIGDRYGTYTVDVAEGQSYAPRLSCLTSLYRLAPSTAPKSIDYAFVLPVRNPMKGDSYGLYNSFNPGGSLQPVYNWLTVYNDGSTTLRASVEVRDVSGNFDASQTPGILELAPGQRRDIALGHPAGQRVGLYRIIPANKNIPYGAFISRYSPTPSGRFNFAFPVMAQQGLCDSGALPASTMDPANNWGEIGNTTASNLPVSIEVRNSAGNIVHQSQLTLPPYAQAHVYLNQYIGARSVGTFRVRCAAAPAGARNMVAQSLFYGRLNVSASAVEWAYVSQARGVVSGESVVLATPINTHLGAANWLKLFNSSSYRETVYVPIFTMAGDPVTNGQSPLYVNAGATADLGLHGQVGANFVGQALSSPFSLYPEFNAEIVRVFPHRSGNIGYIMNIPGAIVEGYDAN